MTDAELLARFTEISETNLFPVQFGDAVKADREAFQEGEWPEEVTEVEQ